MPEIVDITPCVSTLGLILVTLKTHKMILSDKDILHAIASGSISISPYDRANVRTNSYDVHLSPHVKCYATREIDARLDNKVREYTIPPDGWVFLPGRLYLCSTVEYTMTHEHVPCIEGKSSIGRLGISVHATAGVGDVGFCGHWTLEISVIQPVRVYAHMPIAQLLWFQCSSHPSKLYDNDSKYQNQGNKPVASKMWMNFK